MTSQDVLLNINKELQSLQPFLSCQNGINSICSRIYYLTSFLPEMAIVLKDGTRQHVRYVRYVTTRDTAFDFEDQIGWTIIPTEQIVRFEEWKHKERNEKSFGTT